MVAYISVLTVLLDVEQIPVPVSFKPEVADMHVFVHDAQEMESGVVSGLDNEVGYCVRFIVVDVISFLVRPVAGLEDDDVTEGREGDKVHG